MKSAEDANDNAETPAPPQTGLSSIASCQNLAFGYIGTILLLPVLSIVPIFLPPSNPSFAAIVHRVANATTWSDVHYHPSQFPPPPYTLFSTRVVLPGMDEPRAGYVCIGKDGRIRDVVSSLVWVERRFRRVVDVSPLVVMPGLIDPHVHLNSPGRDDWEGFDSGLRAAAAGGTTTVLDMPLNNVPATVDAASLALKREALARSAGIVNVGFIGGVVPQNSRNLSALLNAGVIALKSFLVDTQSPDFDMVTLADFRAAIAFLHQWNTQRPTQRPVPYVLHAELDDGTENTGSRATARVGFDHTSYEAFERTRPPAWETAAVTAVLAAVNGSRVHAHIAHVSAAHVVDILREARLAGLNGGAHVTAETCAHYLTFALENIGPGETLFKCAPPIRNAKNRAKLIADAFVPPAGEIHILEVVATDHSPCAAPLKETDGNLTAAWGGIAGLQYRLGATWRAAQAAGASIVDVSRTLSEGPARVFGLDSVKGALATNHDADIVVWDPNAPYMVSATDCEHRVKASAFNGWMLRGVVRHTLLRGRVVFTRDTDGMRWVQNGLGRYLIRNHEGRIKQEDLRVTEVSG